MRTRDPQVAAKVLPRQGAGPRSPSGDVEVRHPPTETQARSGLARRIQVLFGEGRTHPKITFRVGN